MNTFGEFLAEQRKRKKLTQKELAGMLFVSESTVSKWEQNRANPDITVLPRLSEILGVSEHELITASIDTAGRETQKKAKRWTILSTAWQLTFAISYGVALLTCFIVNLAVDRGLTWFWIVLSSLIFSATFTSLPALIKKNRLLILTVSPLSALFLLLLVCCIYTRGSWFFVSTVPILAAFITVFLPIYIKSYPLPRFFKAHNALLSVAVDCLAFIIMFFVIEGYTLREGYADFKWVTSVALPIFLPCALFTLMITALLRYLPLCRLFKASAVLSLFGLFIPAEVYYIERLMHRVFGDPYTGFKPNLSAWTAETVNSNVWLLCFMTTWVLAAVFLMTGIVLKKKKKDK